MADKSSSNSSMLGDASKTLAWNLHADAMKQTNGTQNYVLSPYSLTAAFGMALLGARGTTFDELLQGLALPTAATNAQTLIDAFRAAQNSVEKKPTQTGDKSAATQDDDGDRPPQLELHTASKLYMQQDFGVSQQYLAKLAQAFSTQLEQVDFRASPEKVRQQINAFVEQVTRNKITDLIPQGMLTEMVRLVLISAVYMKAEWQEKFDKHSTREDGEFYVAHEKRTRNDVPMMSLKKQFEYAENDAAQFVWLPYRGGEASMIVAVPKARDGGLAALQAAVDSGHGGLSGMLKSLKRERVMVQLTMPRFKVETSANLNDIMQRLGVKQPFDEQRADFGDMVQDAQKDKLFIGAALQKVYIKVNKEGIETAAAIAVIMLCKSCTDPMRERIVSVRADRPFIFWVEYDPTGLVLFSGAVAAP